MLFPSIILQSACLLLRVDDIVSGLSKKKPMSGGEPEEPVNPMDADDLGER